MSESANYELLLTEQGQGDFFMYRISCDDSQRMNNSEPT
jgi:hypothetical protein